MSIPFITIRCTACSFQGSSLATFGDFLWKHEDQVYRLDRQMGVCNHCNELVAMEYFPDSTVMERARELHPEYCGNASAIFENDEAKYIASQIGMNVLETVLALHREPVCLTCGGSDVQPIMIPRFVSTRTRIPVCLGISHPECGGLLMVKGSDGMRLAMNPITRVYDIYGQLIMTTSDGPQ